MGYTGASRPARHAGTFFHACGESQNCGAIGDSVKGAVLASSSTAKIAHAFRSLLHSEKCTEILAKFSEHNRRVYVDGLPSCPHHNIPQPVDGLVDLPLREGGLLCNVSGERWLEADHAFRCDGKVGTLPGCGCDPRQKPRRQVGSQ
jgi:hypothetical protein